MNELIGRSDSLETARLAEARESMASRRLRGLLWREHLAHGSLVLGYVGAWLLCQVVLMLFFNPIVVLLFGVACAIYFASAFAGGDARDGAQEFTLTLPATRAEVFRVRLAYSGGVLLSMLIGSVLAVRFELAQRFWGLFVETGFTEPYAPTPPMWLAAWIVVPVAAYAFTFAFAAVASDRATAGTAGTLGFLVTGLAAAAGFAFEYFVLRGDQGILALMVLFVSANACLFFGYRSFLVKDGIYRPQTRRRGDRSSGSSGPLMALIVVGVLLGLAALLTFFLAVRPVEPS